MLFVPSLNLGLHLEDASSEEQPGAAASCHSVDVQLRSLYCDACSNTDTQMLHNLNVTTNRAFRRRLMPRHGFRAHSMFCTVVVWLCTCSGALKHMLICASKARHVRGSASHVEPNHLQLCSFLPFPLRCQGISHIPAVEGNILRTWGLNKSRGGHHKTM